MLLKILKNTTSQTVLFHECCVPSGLHHPVQQIPWHTTLHSKHSLLLWPQELSSEQKPCIIETKCPAWFSESSVAKRNPVEQNQNSDKGTIKAKVRSRNIDVTDLWKTRARQKVNNGKHQGTMNCTEVMLQGISLVYLICLFK